MLVKVTTGTWKDFRYKQICSTYFPTISTTKQKNTFVQMAETHNFVRFSKERRVGWKGFFTLLDFLISPFPFFHTQHISVFTVHVAAKNNQQFPGHRRKEEDGSTPCSARDPRQEPPADCSSSKLKRSLSSLKHFTFRAAITYNLFLTGTVYALK